MGNLDLIVHMHNNVEITLLPVERPLLQLQLVGELNAALARIVAPGGNGGIIDIGISADTYGSTWPHHCGVSRPQDLRL